MHSFLIDLISLIIKATLAYMRTDILKLWMKEIHITTVFAFNLKTLVSLSRTFLFELYPHTNKNIWNNKCTYS